MAILLQQIQALIERDEVRISAHGYDELASDGLLVEEIISGEYHE